MIDFSNTEIAFQGKSDKELSNATFLYTLIKYPLLVDVLGLLSRFALRIHFPVAWAIKPTLYKLFVGGETIEECIPAAQEAFNYKVGSILDYSVEAAQTENETHATFMELMHSVENSGKYKFIPFSVFKPTALITASILKKVNAGKTLTIDEQRQYDAYLDHVDQLCATAQKVGKPILIDAEDYWFQDAIDKTAEAMMQKYNGETAIVYTTLQMYRHDRLDYLKKLLEDAKTKHYLLGIKYVRGAYMEKERQRAEAAGFPSPIHADKKATDDAFNEAMAFSLENIDYIHIFCGTHNEESIRLAIQKMEVLAIPANDRRVFFSQLFGMSDNLSFNLAKAGFHVVKYMPYGKIKSVLPYLIRRAKENTSIAGQTGRELSFLKKESRRRKETN